MRPDLAGQNVLLRLLQFGHLDMLQLEGCALLEVLLSEPDILVVTATKRRRLLQSVGWTLPLQVGEGGLEELLVNSAALLVSNCFVAVSPRSSRQMALRLQHWSSVLAQVVKHEWAWTPSTSVERTQVIKRSSVCTMVLMML